MLCILTRYSYVNQHLIVLTRSSYSSSSVGNEKNLTHIIDTGKTKLKTNFYNLLSWYEQITGVEEVRSIQNRVIEAHERFALAQEKRREANAELNAIKSKIKDIQDELSTVSRGEEKYLVLITQEHKLLKEEVRLTEKFNAYEREERDHFNTLTTNVKESHERERIHANKTKYLSIIGSVMGTLLGVVGSTINNRSKIREIKGMVIQTVEQRNEELKDLCERLELKFVSLNSPDAKTENSDVINKLNKIELAMSNIRSEAVPYHEMEKCISRMEKNLNKVLHVTNNIHNRVAQSSPPKKPPVLNTESEIALPGGNSAELNGEEEEEGYFAKDLLFEVKNNKAALLGLLLLTLFAYKLGSS